MTAAPQAARGTRPRTRELPHPMEGELLCRTSRRMQRGRKRQLLLAA